MQLTRPPYLIKCTREAFRDSHTITYRDLCKLFFKAVSLSFLGEMTYKNKMNLDLSR